jgi:hypothetical protein
MTIRKTDEGDTIEIMLQTKLSLPDADLAPTLGAARLLYLQRSAAYLRQMEHATGDQAARIEALADALGRWSTSPTSPI